MDRPELNTLVDKVRWDSETIEQAMINVVDKFNIITPPNRHPYSVENFPSRYLMVIGVWSYLLKGAAIGEASNNLTYSAAGVQINDRDKAEIFLAIAKDLNDEFIALSKDFKLTQSINKVYGTKGSEYRWRAF